nr:MAG: N-acetylmuramoyl-L-alanine amidase-like protein [Enquatrovirus sp.]
MSKFIMLHSLSSTGEPFKFYVNSAEIVAVMPVLDEAKEKGFRSAVIVKGDAQHGFDVTETMPTILKRLEGASSSNEAETK